MQFLSITPVSPKMKVRRVWNLEIFWWHHSLLLISHQRRYLESANLFTPIESQEQFIMALRIEIKTLGKVGKAAGDSSLLWQPGSFIFRSSPDLPQGFFQFPNYAIQWTSDNLLHTSPSFLCMRGHPHLSPPLHSPAHPVSLDDYKSPCR